MNRYEEIPHTADWALKVRGATMEDLFVNAAEGMYALMGSSPTAGSPQTTREIALDASDVESLLVGWLNELLYFTESEGLAFTRFAVKELTPTRLMAEAVGGPASEIKKYIKAATFHNLKIERTDEGVEATVVFDV